MAKLEQSHSAEYSVGQIVVKDDTLAYVRRKLLVWGREHFENFPWRNSTDDFHTLIAEILLQRTKASQVVSTYLNFIEQYHDPTSLAGASIREIEDVIRPLGLRWRAKLLVRLGKTLEEINSRVPDEQQALVSLPGVGAYVSAAYLSLHRGRRAPIVDSNIVRFYGRFFGFGTGPETRRNRAVIRLADRITPERKFKEFNYALIDFTRSVCKPRPTHEECPIKVRCHLWISASNERGATKQS